MAPSSSTRRESQRSWPLPPGKRTDVGRGAAGLSVALALFIGNLAATLRAAVRRDVTWWALTGATVFLAVTVVFGMALTGNLRWGFLGADRLTALGVHMHVAISGWVLLVVIGVARHLLPMFLLSHVSGDRWTKAAVGLVAGGAGVLTVLHHGPTLLGVWLPAALLAGGFGAFLVQAARIFRHR